MFNLGVCYHKGEGLEIDPFAAIEWFKSAAALGHEGAISVLKKMGF